MHAPEGLFAVALCGVEVPALKLRRFLQRAAKSQLRLTGALGLAARDRVAVEVVDQAGGASGSAEGIAIPVRCVLQPRRHPVFEHELVHVLAARSRGYATAFLREGLAYHLTRTGAAWAGRASGNESVGPPATLRAYRDWHHAITAAASADGQLPSLASLQITPYFWALARLHRTDLDFCVAVSAAASFTHYLLRAYGRDRHRQLYQAAGRQDMGWESDRAAALLQTELNTPIVAIADSWTRFAEQRGGTNAEAKAAYERLRAMCGRVSQPTRLTNCPQCGQWRESPRQACRACGAESRVG